MNVDVGIWPKLSKLVLFTIFVAIILAVVIWYLPVIKHNEAMRKEILHLETQIQREEELGKQLENSIKALRNDPKTVERAAREKLSYIKPGDTMIRFEAPATNNVLRR
jgi:cell division protein FtsB